MFSSWENVKLKPTLLLIYSSEGQRLPLLVEYTTAKKIPLFNIYTVSNLKENK